MEQFDPVKHRIFECIVGSHLYGLSNPDSDTDYRGVTIAPMSVLLDPFMGFEVKDSGFDEKDRAIYSLGKFMTLCADANPNLTEMFFVPDEYVVFKTNKWNKIIENRNLFLSKNIKYRFLGYSFSQLKALDRHRQWFLEPPDHKPTRAEFGLAESPTISMAWLNSMKMTMNFEIIKDEFVVEIKKEEAYKEAKRRWDGYIQWKENRNPNRKASEEKCGYDGKYASHTFRLMEEGRQLLLDGEIHFPLSNANFLLDVKNGEYSYEYIMARAKDIEKQFDEWYDISPLPHSPNRNKLKELYFELLNDNSWY